MATNYDLLKAYVQNADPLTAAKAITAWCYSSLLPQGYTQPTSATDVANSLGGSCGWRDILMESLFQTIGVEHKRVALYGVPFQSSHTATELNIGGKWLFFDPTFGIYLTNLSGRILSLEEARANWDNVLVKKYDAPGMTGQFLSLPSIDLNLFKNYNEKYFLTPSAVTYSNRGDVINGELTTLYMGENSTYVYKNGSEYKISSKYNEINYFDTNNKFKWSEINESWFKGLLEFKYTLYDNRSKLFNYYGNDNKNYLLNQVFVDGNNVDIFKKLSYSNGDVILINNDQFLQYSWKNQQTYLDKYGKAYYKVTANDNNTKEYIFYYPNAGELAKFTSDVAEQILDITLTTSGINSTAVSVIGNPLTRNYLVSSHGVDWLVGGGLNDTLNDEGNKVAMFGGSGNDIFTIRNLSSSVLETFDSGLHDLVISDFSYTLPMNVEDLTLSNGLIGRGNDLNNIIKGNSLNNVIYSYLGNDTVFSYQGNDTIYLGLGADIVYPGSGNNKIFFGNDAMVDRLIYDATVGTQGMQRDKLYEFKTGDIIDFRKIDANPLIAGQQHLTSALEPKKGSYWCIGSNIYVDINQNASADLIITVIGIANAADQVILA
jgi:hypothetical protein